jgi:hypothetical protein
MNIKLNCKQAKIVEDELKSGHFCNVEEVVAKALQALREKEQSSSVCGTNGQQREAVREMLDFVEKNHTRMDAVSVKHIDT